MHQLADLLSMCTWYAWSILIHMKNRPKIVLQCPKIEPSITSNCSLEVLIGMALILLCCPLMSRIRRIQESDLHYHIIARCNNEAFHFETNEDFDRYLEFMKFFQKKHRFRLFNYELMNSHVHLFLQPSPTLSLGKTMHAIHWNYANDFNRRKKRKGHFWMDRYKSIPVSTDEHALILMRYINRNPVRAGMTSLPGEWEYSGYRFYAFGETNDLLESHPTYLGLSPDEETRRRLYREFVRQSLPGDQRNSNLSDGKFIGSTAFGRKLGLKVKTG